MNEPTPEKGNLDELTRLTLRVISLETELKKAVELSELRDKTLEARIIILEQSRQAQRSLNDTFARKELTKEPKRFKWF